MAISNIQTSDPAALAYLLNDTLFRIPEGEQQPIPDNPEDRERQPARFAYYGGNNRRYLFLTEDEQHEWMSPAALEALSKTLAALKLSVADIALLNLGKLPAMPSGAQLISFFKPKVAILLGTSESLFVPDCPVGESVTDETGLTVFRTDSFDALLVDAEKKRQFWTAIKKLLT